MNAEQRFVADALLEARRLTELLSQGRPVSREQLDLVDAKLQRALATIDQPATGSV
jgi:hypothetical protein